MAANGHAAEHELSVQRATMHRQLHWRVPRSERPLK
jgi:hypothetical protein